MKLNIKEMEVSPSQVEMTIDELKTVNFSNAENVWRKGFDILREFEREVVKNPQLLEFFIYEIQKFNGILNVINSQRNGKIGYTTYWILRIPLKREIQYKYHLKDGIFLRNGHIDYFLKESVMIEEDGNFFYSEEEYDEYIKQTDCEYGLFEP